MVAVRPAPQTKSVDFLEFKAVDETQGIFEGYLSCFGNVDSYKDIVERGAFQKTINDARGRHSTYLFPLLWQHDPKEPIGGFMEMQEDPKGLFVRGQIDLATPRGKQAYSGIKMGYLSGLSIGYDTIKHKYVGDIRHLLEVRMWEGSIVTFPANPETQISHVKSACGSTDWPLADREEAWDGSAAHNEIVDWATNDDGTLDVGKMKSVHFWVSDDDPQKLGSYKLPFCRIKSGSPVAIPRGIFAVAGALGGARGKGADLDGDDDAVKARVNTYYNRMKEKFNDDSIIPPWKSEDKQIEEEEDVTKKQSEDQTPSQETPEQEEVKEEKHDPGDMSPFGDSDDLEDFDQELEPRDFQTIMDQRTPDELIDELYDLFGALLTAVLENMYGVSDQNACKATIIKSIGQFQNYILDWLDDAYDAGLGAEEEDEDEDDNDEEDDQQGDEEEGNPAGGKKYVLYPSMTIAHFTLSTRALKHAIREYIKEGRMLSGNTHSRICNSIDSIMGAAKQLHSLLEDSGQPYIPNSENIYVPNGENEDGPPDENDEDAEEASSKKPADPTQPTQAQQKKSDEEPSDDTQLSETPSEAASESLSEEDLMVIMQMQLHKMQREFEAKKRLVS